MSQRSVKNIELRSCFIILLLAVSFPCFAQRADMQSLSKAISSFDKALVDKDSTALRNLLHNDVLYGHSNGWIETKKEVIEDLFNGKLTYKQIAVEKTDIKRDGGTAAARIVTEIDVILDGKAMNFKLNVLQVWIWRNKRWELFTRQSVKI